MFSLASSLPHLVISGEWYFMHIPRIYLIHDVPYFLIYFNFQFISNARYGLLGDFGDLFWQAGLLQLPKLSHFATDKSKPLGSRPLPSFDDVSLSSKFTLMYGKCISNLILNGSSNITCRLLYIRMTVEKVPNGIQFHANGFIPLSNLQVRFLGGPK